MTTNIDELEGAALDFAVATKVMGWHQSFGSIYGDWWYGSPNEITVRDWSPSQNIAQAFQVKAVHPEWLWAFCETYEDQLRVDVWTKPGSISSVLTWVDIQPDDRTRAWRTAILRAALKAVEVG